MFLFGQIDMPIKLVPGHSTGTVLAFYLTSDQPNRDEIYFQFLGNVSGQPYILQTSVYADGFDNREERIYLWFDPTKDFHTYSILWNLHQIGLNHVRTLKGHEHKNGRFFSSSNRVRNSQRHLCEKPIRRMNEEKIGVTVVFMPLQQLFLDLIIFMHAVGISQ
ncbi:putative xyloglucan:xyloglucosyl transferase [Helianthus annuus]|uniref:Xyloglucan:xyloglucosyl transferase n=1 Tax=Helianthus annuus TaxID=4232 RepID=A0A9K3IZS8_HELAN|nr:putative xyloglucan:xyloglucosyl transferase [Helianthus annuus]KAJ0584467.1 putative xyloglucan:xyloglucosyl transferase [Helianthus annuus]KAJ0747084.1 putative xyloglucan:xyloglucosyl transferase [Helianthus annuus]